MLSIVQKNVKASRYSSRLLSSLSFDNTPNHHHHIQPPIIGQQNKGKKPTFDPEHSRPFKDRRTTELLQSLVVFHLCQFQPLVQHGEKILHQTRKIFGDKLTDALIKLTFFKQFCGGEDHYQVVGKMRSLQNYGIGSILDYAAEDEGTEQRNPSSKAGAPTVVSNIINQPAREYDYESEELCDARVQTFHHCIQTVHDAGEGRQFSAIKLTGLGNPKLLKRISDYAMQIKATIRAHDENAKGYVTRDEFIQAHRSLFNDNTKIDALLDRFDSNNIESIDYMDWCSASFALDLESERSSSMVNIVPGIVKFTTEEIDLIHALQNRAYSVALKAADLNVSLLIDAEQSWFQPAIDVISIGLQQSFNDVNKTNKTIIFNTYQCYLKDSLDRIKEDLRRSQHRGYHFGAKLVRGAYMHRERTRAAEMGYPSPIHDTVQDTHDCYNASVEYLLRQMNHVNMPSIEVMCATHNKESIEKAIEMFEMLGLSNLPSSDFNATEHDSVKSKLSFAQLYGMSDDLTNPLGKMGYNVYKYLPYGQVQEVIPYMLRRAQENGDMLGKSQHEIQLILKELKERCKLL